MRYYEDVSSHRKWSVLPPPLQMSAVRLGISIETGRVDRTALTEVVSGLSHLPVQAYPQASQEIRDLAKLYTRYKQKRSLLDFFWSRKSEGDLLRSSPALRFL